MKHLTFYLDFISPYAYLAFHALPESLMGLSYSVTYKPVFLGALLKHNAMLGPAEVPPKRDWVYRQVHWQAQQQGLVFEMPALHPFNPLGLLRLAVASRENGCPNRYICDTLFRHVWVGGLDAADPKRLAALTEQVAPPRAPGDESVARSDAPAGIRSRHSRRNDAQGQASRGRHCDPREPVAG